MSDYSLTRIFYWNSLPLIYEARVTETSTVDTGRQDLRANVVGQTHAYKLHCIFATYISHFGSSRSGLQGRGTCAAVFSMDNWR